MDSLSEEIHITLRCDHEFEKYPAKSHARRVAQKLGYPEAVILLTGTKTEPWPGSDMPRPFRQDRDMYYLSGCNEPGTNITYDVAKDILTLWLPPIDKDRVVWTGRGSTVQEALEKYDIDHARYIPSQETTWPGRDYGLTPIFSLSEEQCSVSRMKPRLRMALDACRVIKDGHEIQSIRKANRVTANAHKKVMSELHTFTNEAEVEGAYMNVCISQKAKTQAYDPIAGAGENAGILHYAANTTDFGLGQTLVLDAGCEVDCYASDVTRTMPLNGKGPGRWPSKEAQQIYELVETIQETCINMLRPGVDFLKVSDKAQRMVAQGLLKLGVLHGDVDEILKQGTHRAFYPHGLGHHLGLDVHDVSPRPHPPLINGEPRSHTVPSVEISSSVSYLEPGMVITIEPGIYFNRFLIGQVYLPIERHRDLIDEEVLENFMRKVGGVRIEDNILITEDGYENLTTALKGQAMLEYMRESAKKGQESQ